MNAAAIVKHCRCGRAFTREQWQSLPEPPGERPASDDVFAGLDMRNCKCGSTLAVIVAGAANDSEPPPTLRSARHPGYTDSAESLAEVLERSALLARARRESGR